MMHDNEADPMEQEQWEQFARKYPRESRGLARDMWNFVRNEFKVDPRKLGRKGMEKLFTDMAMSKSVKYQRTISKPAYDKGRIMGRRLVSSREGKVHEKGAWNRGLHEQVISIHESRTRAGKPYARSYRRWSDTELEIVRSRTLPFEDKVELTGRSDDSIRTRMRRL